MTTIEYWRLIMLVAPVHEGGHQDVSTLGYADLATEFEEATLESFDSYTFGKTSEEIIITDVLDNHSILCKLDDDSPLCIVTPEDQDSMLNFEETIFNEFIKRLEKNNGKTFAENEIPEFDWTLFTQMIQQEPLTLKPFIIAGYFEHPSTIEDSKAELVSALEQKEADDEDE